MKYFLSALIVLFSHIALFAQCSCTDCPIPVISNSTATSNLVISGAANDQLGQNGQSLCQICMNFNHDAPDEILFTLTSPSGSFVTLINNTGLSSNQNVTFDICFVSCNQTAMPDPGFSAVFDSSEPWASNTTYSGTYYPSQGCLEDLMGNVNGNWTLTMSDLVGLDDGTMFNWNLIFSDDTGLGCGGAGSCATTSPCDAEAGIITASPQPACPGETVNYTVTGYETDPAFTQLLVVTDNNGMIVEIIVPGTTGSLTRISCVELQLHSYNYDPTSGSPSPILGANISLIDCSTGCCDLESIPLVFEDNLPPVFTNPPQDENLNCFDELQPAGNLAWTDNCGNTGQAIPMESGVADLCNGGVLTRLWQVEDDCGNIGFHSQLINIAPTPIASYLLPPPNITVSCETVPQFPPQLSYTNFGNGACEIQGLTDGQVQGSYDECGGLLFFIWNDVDFCGRPLSHVQNITVAPAADPIFLNPPMDMTISCDAVPATPPNLSYTNFAAGVCLVEGIASPQVIDNTSDCGGEIIYLWEIVTDCGSVVSHIQNITIDPPAPATFINPPGNITLSCENFLNTPADLNYTNGLSGACEISGTVSPTVTGSPDPCGSLITNEWIFQDDCGRMITHSQEITVEPAPPPAFINVPTDITITCDQLPIAPAPLEYTNASLGACLISGFAPGLQTGSADVCGGSYQHFWDYTDACGRNISFIQNIDVLPGAPPVFINPPADLTLSCVEPFPVAADLTYSNNAAGICLIEGVATPSAVMLDPMTQVVTWDFIHPCTNQNISHTQTITQLTGPDISLNPDSLTICTGDNYDLNDIAIIDANATNPTITFHSGTPADNTNELPGTIISPVTDTIIYVLATDVNNCSVEIPFVISVDAAPSAGMDGNAAFCLDWPNTINLSDYLTGSPDPGGAWTDLDGSSVDITDPTMINLVGLATGIYRFEYSIGGTGSCPLETAIVTLEILPAISITIDLVTCSADLTSYEVTIQSNGYEIISSDGVITDLGGNVVLISGIPLLQDITITATDVGSQCMDSFMMTAPDCSCDPIDPPISAGDQSICEGENNPDLVVTVGAGETANWYDAPSGGNLLLANNTIFQSAESAVGIYQYYIETENIADGCVSSTRTLIQFEIFPLPIANDAILEICDVDDDGIALFDLTLAQNDINGNAGINFSFYPTLIDAQNQSNTLSTPFLNTTPFSQTIFVRVQNDDDCFQIAELDLQVYPLPDLQLLTTLETCLGDNDGAVTITSAAAVNYSLDGISWGTNNIFASLSAGNYTAYVQDANDCTNDANFEITPGLELSVENFQSICDDNNTSTDPTDDSYTLTFVVNNNLGQTGSFEMTTAATSFGFANYGELINLPVPADGQSFILNIIDNSNGCMTSVNVGPLNPCSTDCEIVLNSLNVTCQDNGTSTDPSDDFYNITFNADALNNGGSTTYDMILDGVNQGVAIYGIDMILTAPADGSSPNLILIDTQNNQCQIQQQIGPLDPCSGSCLIDANITNIICDNAGTGAIDTDDTYTFDLLITGQNVSTDWVIASTGLFGSYGTVVNVGPLLISDGIINLDIQDALDQSCMINIPVTPPASCSNCTGTVDAGLSPTITCGDPIAVVTGTSNEPGTFVWTDELGNVVGNGLVIDVTQSGWCYLTGYFADNCTAEDSVFINIEDDLPIANAGPDQTIDCDFLSVTLDGSQSSVGGEYIYTWTDNIGNVVGQTMSINMAVAGNYFLEVENLNSQCIAIDEVMVNESLTLPIANAGMDQTLDCNVAMATLDGSLSSSGANYEYTWTNINGTVISTDQSTTVNTEGVFTLEVRDTTNGCISIVDQVEVFENMAAPIANAGPDQIINCIVTTITLDGTVVPFDPNIEYSWTNNNGVEVSDLPTLQTMTPGTYNLQLVNTVNGCASAVDVVNIEDQTQEPLAIIFTDPDTVINCSITAVDLSTQVEDNVVYSWEVFGEVFIQNQITINNPGTINLLALDTLTGCANTNAITINDFTDYPIIDINSPDAISCNAVEITIDASNSQSGSTISYVWYDEFGNPIPGANTTMLTVELGGFYILESTDSANNCVNTDTIFVESLLQAPLSEPAEDVMLPCLETETTLLFNLLGPTTDLTINWSTIDGSIINGQGTPSPEINGVGLYVITVENNISGCFIEDSILVTNNPNVPEAVIADVINEGCLEAENGSIAILGIDGGEGPYNYSLNNNQSNTTGNFTNLVPGLYNLEIEDNNGCSTDTSFQIDPGVDVEIVLPEIIELIENQTGTLQALVDIPEDQIASISWTPDEFLSCNNCLTTQVSAVTSEEYLITIIHENGCVTTASIRLLVRPDVNIYVPNTFSPNGDGINDQFTLYGNERIVNIESLTIFDRWGEQVFKNENFDHSTLAFGWDGTFRSKALNPAVFVYTFVVNLDDGTQERISGDVTLMR